MKTLLYQCMSGLTLYHLSICGGFTEYFPAARPRTNLAFLHLKTIDQNASLEAKLIDFTSILQVKGYKLLEMPQHIYSHIIKRR